MRFDHSSGQYLDREGARIYFETTGASSGRTVVLLHGGLGSLKDFNSFLGLLPGNFTTSESTFADTGAPPSDANRCCTPCTRRT